MLRGFVVGPAEREMPGHSEVDHQHVVGIELDQKEFTAPVDARDPPLLEPQRQPLGSVGRARPRLPDADHTAARRMRRG